jgi:hypothetical protein
VYEVRSTEKSPKDKSNVATQAERQDAIRGTLKPRSVQGTKRQADLVKRGADGKLIGHPVGVTTGLPIFLAVAYVFQQNEKAPRTRKLTDQQIAEWLRAEFPGRATKYWDDVQWFRVRYNNGKLTRGVRPELQSHRYDSGGENIDPAYKPRSKRK